MNTLEFPPVETGPQQFASDNYAGICPDAWQAMAAANHGIASAYGEDPWSMQAANGLRTLFECNCDVFFAFNGTAANLLALAALCQSYHSVICAASAHIETDECGAPEFFSNGSKILLASAPDGKLTPDAVRTLATSRTDVHFPKPRVVTITQPTETGRVYSVDEIRALSAVCRELGLKLHMDGARFAQACATLCETPAELTWKAGQLASKMRFLVAPWVGLLAMGTWLANAQHGNAMAQRLAAEVKNLQGVELMFPVEANAVFVRAPDALLEHLRNQGWHFYTFIGGGARFMFAWDAETARVDALAADIRRAAQAL